MDKVKDSTSRAGAWLLGSAVAIGVCLGVGLAACLILILWFVRTQ